MLLTCDRGYLVFIPYCTDHLQSPTVVWLSVGYHRVEGFIFIIPWTFCYLNIWMNMWFKKEYMYLHLTRSSDVQTKNMDTTLYFGCSAHNRLGKKISYITGFLRQCTFVYSWYIKHPSLPNSKQYQIMWLTALLPRAVNHMMFTHCFVTKLLENTHMLMESQANHCATRHYTR